MSPLSRRTRTAYFVVLFLAFVIGVPLLLLYVSGYRVNLDRDFAVRGGLSVYSTELGTRVYIDGELQEESSFFDRRFFSQSLKPRMYHVVVDHEKYLPWEKNVRVRANRVTSLHPFLLLKEIEVEDVEPITYDFTEAGELTRISNPRYLLLIETFLRRKVAREELEELRAEAEVTSFREVDELIDPLIASRAVPTEETETLLQDGTVSTQTVIGSDEIPEDAPVHEKGKFTVWVNEGKIFAHYGGRDGWVPEYFCDQNFEELVCKNPLLVYETDKEIKLIDFFPGYDDALLVLLEDGLYVIELDIRNRQVFEKIYSGVAEDFVIGEERSVYIKAGSRITRLVLE